MIGSTLGHYRIVEKLGRGGMGEVYRAHDTSLDRDVALKVLPAETAGDAGRVKRFEREAKAIAALKHPNIVTIHAVENIDGVNFIAMELVEGKTLSEVIPDGGLPLERIFEIAIPLADALSSAHSKGITHRDLKPANIMFDDAGRVKVLDFGLAKLFTPSDDAGDATMVADESVTAEGKVLGTVAYMSPEQAEGKQLDHRSDIFSLGVVLYEMATGKRPFAGDTPISTISAILKDTPAPVTAFKEALPRHMARVIGRCLEKNPDKRFQTARDVCNELEGLQKEVESGEIEVTTGSISRETVAMAAARGRRSPWPFVGTAVVVIALAVAASALFFRKPPVDTASNVTSKLVTSLVGVEEPGSWSPDGGFFAYAHAANGPMDIFIVSTAGGDAIRLVESPGDDVLPRWSPDNRWIAFASNRDGGSGIYLVPPLGGSVQKLVDTGFSTLSGQVQGTLGSAPWAPDGRTLVFSRRGDDGVLAVWKVDLETRAETQLSHPQAGEWDMAGSVSFAGDRIVFNRSIQTGAKLLVIPFAGGEPRELLSDKVEYIVGAWSSDDRQIVYSSDKGGLWSLDVASRKTRQVTAGASQEGGAVVSKGGRILYGTFSHQTDLYVQNVDGSGEERLTFHTQDNFGPQFSPDGTKVVYMSTRSGDPEIWLIDLGSGDERQLTNREGRDDSPRWNPNGRDICFVSDRDGKPQLWKMSVSGGVPSRIADTEVAFGNWSPDGAHIGFRTLGDPGAELWIMDADGSNGKKVLDDVDEFCWYHDARHVIYTPETRETENQLRVVDLETGEDAVLLDEPHREVEITPDGSALSFCSATSHFNMNLHILRLAPGADGLPHAVGAPVKITHGDGKWHVHNGGFSPDGTRVIYTRDTDSGDLSILDGAFAK